MKQHQIGHDAQSNPRELPKEMANLTEATTESVSTSHMSRVANRSTPVRSNPAMMPGQQGARCHLPIALHASGLAEAEAKNMLQIKARLAENHISCTNFRDTAVRRDWPLAHSFLGAGAGSRARWPELG